MGLARLRASISKHLHDQPTPPAGSVADLEVELERLLLDCLARDPADGPGSARELRDRLERSPSRATWTRVQALAWWQERHSLLRSDGKTMAATPTGLAATSMSRKTG